MIMEVRGKKNKENPGNPCLKEIIKCILPP